MVLYVEMHEIESGQHSDKELTGKILSNQQPIPVRRSDQDRYFLLDLKSPGKHQSEANYVVSELMRLYAGKSLLSNREGIDDHQHKIDQLQGRSGDQAFAINLKIDEEGEIQGWGPEVFPNAEDFIWWQVATSPGVIQPYLEAQEMAGDGIEWVDEYIYARIAHDSMRLMHKPDDKEALYNYRSRYNRYFDENRETGAVLVPVMSAVTEFFKQFN